MPQVTAPETKKALNSVVAPTADVPSSRWISGSDGINSVCDIA